jgi:hypothetical protein
MLRFAGESDWLTIFRVNSDLLWEFLIHPSVQAQSVKRGRDGAGRDKPPPRNDKPGQLVRDKANKNRKTQQGGAPAKTKFCKSRLFTSVGTCTFSPCRFLHDCPCCGQDHPASECPKWVESVAQAKNVNGIKP